MLRRQLRSALLLLLVVTAVVSFFVGNRTDAVIIAVILVASVGLGFVNDYRAELAAGNGVVSGRAALSVASARQLAAQDDRVVLLRRTATTDDIAALAVCAGLVTASGARTSHAAVVARQLGIATVVGCRELSIDVGRELVRFGGHEIAEGALVTVDGDRGLVFEGELTTTIERPTALIERVRAWRASATNGYATTLTAPAS